MDDTSLAQTHFYVDNDTSEIEWAMIYMRADLRKTVLEHELGHALGFLHYNMINHLMNEKWTMGGWDKEGLENQASVGDLVVCVDAARVSDSNGHNQKIYWISA